MSEPSLQSLNLIITSHAYERAKERLGWDAGALEKMAKRSFSDGIKHSDTKGKLNRWLTKLWFNYKTCNNVRIYGQNIFFFRNNILITLYQVPNEFKKYIKTVKL